MECRESRESSSAAHRSYLFLTMILLVWNVAMGGFPPAQPLPRFSADPGSEAPAPGPADDGSNGIEGRSPRSGPLSARQKFLLGKRLDMNTASETEIAELPGISAAVAAAVVSERRRVGRFRAPEDLLRVRGIKRKRLEKILPFLAAMANN